MSTHHREQLQQSEDEDGHRQRGGRTELHLEEGDTATSLVQHRQHDGERDARLQEATSAADHHQDGADRRFGHRGLFLFDGVSVAGPVAERSWRSGTMEIEREMEKKKLALH